MRVWIRVSLILFALTAHGCTHVPQQTAMPEPQPQLPIIAETALSVEQPTEKELKERVDQLLKEVVAVSFKVRVAATKKLRSLLKDSGDKRLALLDHVQKRFDESEDPELHHRIDPVLRPWKYFKKLRVLRTKDEYVRQLVFSPDGKLLVAVYLNKTIRIWDPHTGKCLHHLKGHTKKIQLPALVFSPDAKLLASGSYDSTIRIWNPRTGECLHVLRGHKGWVNSVDFSPDGKLLASSANTDNVIRIWNPQSGECVRELRGHDEGLNHDEGINSVAYSPDGKLLASAGDDRTVRVWNSQTGECLHTLEGHDLGCVSAVSFSPDGRLVASMGGSDGTVRLWNPQKGECLKAVYVGDLRWLKFSPDSSLLALFECNEGIHLLETQTCKLSHTLKSYGGSVFSFSFSPDSRFLACGPAVGLWDTQTGKCVRILGHHGLETAWWVQYSPDGRILASTHEEEIVIWGLPEE